MAWLQRRKPSASMVVALIALFVALGGTSYAAVTLGRNSVGSKQLTKNAVTTAKIKNGAVTATKIDPAGFTAANAAALGGKGPASYAPSVLPSGKTEAGSYSAWGGTGWFGDTITFRIQLPAAISGADTSYISQSSSFTTDCPGIGQAAPGHLCVYERFAANANLVGVFQSEGTDIADPGASQNSFWVYYSSAGNTAFSYGAWAVTAP